MSSLTWLPAAGKPTDCLTMPSSSSSLRAVLRSSRYGLSPVGVLTKTHAPDREDLDAALLASVSGVEPASVDPWSSVHIQYRCMRTEGLLNLTRGSEGQHDEGSAGRLVAPVFGKHRSSGSTGLLGAPVFWGRQSFARSSLSLAAPAAVPLEAPRAGRRREEGEGSNNTPSLSQAAPWPPRSPPAARPSRAAPRWARHRRGRRQRGRRRRPPRSQVPQLCTPSAAPWPRKGSLGWTGGEDSRR